jgi:hypothetical protein
VELMDSQGILEIFGKEIISGSPREENIWTKRR